MPTGTGLDAQVGAKLESTYGTPVTVDRFWPFDGSDLQWLPTFREPTGLRAGSYFKRGSELAVTREGVSGSVNLQHRSLNMGLWWKLAMFSAVTNPVTLVAPATRQIHTFGSTVQSATVQLGRPEPSTQAVRAHTYAGTVVTGWELTVSDQETVNMTINMDGRSESTATALATASFVTGTEIYSFRHASNFKLGGTASTASGLVSIAGGAAVTSIASEFSLSGDNSLFLERYGLGNAGLKGAPRITDFRPVTGSFTAEYLQSELYTPFKAGTKMPLQMDFVASAIGASGSSSTLSIVIPQIIIKSAPAPISGPGIVTQTVGFEMYDDEVNTPLQVVIISSDPTTAL